ncbi:MAG: diguanylate cyclase [Proteobacteria bacterium]|nr:diguanylate cyclase [Pseudomonadota bacterium]
MESAIFAANAPDTNPAVLIVDDDPSVLSSLSRTLKREFTILTASSAKQATQVLEQSPVAVLVADMSMPEVSGLELIEMVRPRHPEIVSIMLTGRLDQQIASDAINRGGVFRFLSKPCESERIKAAISDALMQHRLLAAKRELLVKTETLEAAFSAMHDGICIVDAGGRLSAANGRARTLLGAEECRLGEPPPRALVQDSEPTGEIPVNDHLLQVSSADLSTGGRLVVLHDVTVVRQLEQRLRMEASTDPLTQISNRRRFLEFAAEQRARAVRYGRPISILMVDVDHFKKVNDQYGHASGDDVLRRIAAILAAGVRSTDMAARFGGEEFIALLSETATDEAALIGERLRQAIAAEPIPSAGGAIPVTASIGLATAVGADVDIERLIAAADGALYAAKKNGRNRLECAAQADLVVAV